MDTQFLIVLSESEMCMSQAHRFYCDGEWIESNSGETFTVRNLANPNDAVAEFPR